MEDGSLDVAEVYFKAEIFRFFECETLRSVNEEVKMVLQCFDDKSDIELTGVSDSYYAYLLNKS